ncbi:hypothetical protein HYC85_024377 [Camellia sinensis]|uniref:CSN8/PSMD8/EIF3K domain-containing protein n=1 Tax=Camellia sinensis TaxID=4442 RepID=A0A7J7GAB9_CAMSI|nr:hypothetical protein HYC85_024377 [Camellia sinensis]
MASKSYDKIADICDDHILQAHTLSLLLLLFHCFNAGDYIPGRMALLDSSSRPHLHRRHCYCFGVLRNSARFLWKSIPSSVKESRPELVAVWKICQRLWMRDHAGVHEAIRGFNWSQETRDLVASFSDVLQQGWSVDPASRMLTVKKQPVVTEQKLDPSKLQRLTEYFDNFWICGGEKLENLILLTCLASSNHDELPETKATTSYASQPSKGKISKNLSHSSLHTMPNNENGEGEQPKLLMLLKNSTAFSTSRALHKPRITILNVQVSGQ